MAETLGEIIEDTINEYGDAGSYKKGSEEDQALKFESEDEALQCLADITGQRIIVGD